MSYLGTRHRLWVIAAALLATGLAACKRDVAPPAKSAPVTIEEAQTFSQALEASLNECSETAVNEAFDLDALVRLAASSSKASPAVRRGFVQGAKQSAVIGQRFCNDRGEGTYKLLRVREEGGETLALFRLAGPDGLNYYDVVLSKDAPDAPVLARDVYIFLSGERLSDSMRNLFDAALRSHADGKVSEINETSQKMTRMRSLMDMGRFDEVHKLLDSLPAELQRDKSIMLIRVTASASLPEADYQKAIDQFAQAFPDDPSLDLVSIDGFVLKQQWDEAVAAIDRLDQRIGGDAFLHSLRAGMYIEKGDVAKARVHAVKAVEAEPELQDVHWMLLTLELQDKQHAAAIERMTLLAKSFGVEFDEASMRTEPLYADLLTSAEYQAWPDRPGAD